MKKRTNIILTMAIGLMTLGLTTTARADTCTVNVVNDVNGQAGAIRTVIANANRPTSANRFRICTSGIKITANVTVNKGNLRIAIPETNSATPYVIEGNVNGAPAILDFSPLSRETDDPNQFCALSIENTSHIILRNIIIKNSPWSGICLGQGSSSVNNVTLENVTVDQARGHGILVAAGSKQTVIKASSSVRNTSMSAVHYKGSSVNNDNALEGTDRSAGALNTETGLSTLPETENPKNFVMQTIGSQNYISSELNVAVRIDRVLENEAGVFDVEGRVVKAAPDADGTIDVCSADSVTSGDDIQRLQIYNANSNSGAFFNYVVGSSTSGIGLDTSSTDTGYFRFIIDTNAMGSKQIVLVPEMSTGQVANSGKRATLADEYTDCPQGATGNTGGTGGDADARRRILSGGQGYYKKFESIQECLRKKNARDRYDTDGDGRLDNEEDTDNDCYPTTNDISDWTNPDSDGDGILDGDELRRPGVKFLTEEERETHPGRFCMPAGTVAITDATDDPCNADYKVEKNGGSIISNAWDTDSDEDGIEDFKEDRQRILNPWKVDIAYIRYQSYKWPCQPENRGSLIDWAVYEINADKINDPDYRPVKRVFQFDQPLERNVSLVTLACASEALKLDANGTDYDGVMLAGVETNPYKTDSDGDGFCDGDGRGCTVDCSDGDTSCFDEHKPDNCPSDYSTAALCQPKCAPGEDLYRINANETYRGVYVEFNDAQDPNEPTGLVMGTDNQPALFEIPDWMDLFTICPDRDGDQIPDCVERMDPLCETPERLAIRTTLNPYSIDTDGDGYNDRRDINPLVPNPGNNIVTPQNKSSLRSIFQVFQHPIVRCFTDRDGDELLECDEDKNKDARYQPSDRLTLKEFIAKRDSDDVTMQIETDPLDADSDDDGLDDALETQLGINPTHPDTDQDGLYDRTELVNDAHGSYADQGKTECTGFLTVATEAEIDQLNIDLAKDANRDKGTGTNPLDDDTDDDDLNDRVEIVGTITTSKDPFNPDKTIYDNGFPGEQDFVSNPLSKDSDGDHKPDGAEYNGTVRHKDSSPCDVDTDGDGLDDAQAGEGPEGQSWIDEDPYSTNSSLDCTGMSESGPDSDCDGLADVQERRLGTDPNNRDTDGDGLLDGQEDANHDGYIQPNDISILPGGETDPRCEPRISVKDASGNTTLVCVGYDSDGDGLNDGDEDHLGTNPNDTDSDDDCIPDGVEVNFNSNSTFGGTDTNPLSPDTDGDGLCDGNNSHETFGCIAGEDDGRSPGAIACNGKVDTDPNNPNRFLETDPRSADTDFDGVDDRTEKCHGSGPCFNVGRAVEGENEGCFNLNHTANGGPSSMFYLFGLLLVWNRFTRRRLKKNR